MAVYTKINKKEISYINKKFKVDKIISFKGIKQGIENTNYLLKSKKNKFILTIFEKRVSKKEIPFFMKLMDQLNTYKINCPKPIKNKNGKYLINVKNKSACIVSFLDGKDKKSLSPKNCYDIGKMIGQMHLSTRKIKLYRKNSMGLKNLNPLLNSIKFKSKKFSNLQKFLTNNLKEIKKNILKNLNKFLIIFFVFGVIYFYYPISLDTFGGGVFLKISNILNSKIIFFISSFLGTLLILINLNKNNFIVYLCLIFAFPTIIIYQKYYDPLLMITILIFTKDGMLNQILDLNKINLIYIYSYFIFFLIISNLYYSLSLWI